MNDINHAFSIAMSGMQVRYLYDADKRFLIVISISDRYHNNINAIAQIPIGVPDGGIIPISTISNVDRT